MEKEGKKFRPKIFLILAIAFWLTLIFDKTVEIYYRVANPDAFLVIILTLNIILMTIAEMSSGSLLSKYSKLTRKLIELNDITHNGFLSVVKRLSDLASHVNRSEKTEKLDIMSKISEIMDTALEGMEKSSKKIEEKWD